jgi:hypothetical protein
VPPGVRYEAWVVPNGVGTLEDVNATSAACVAEVGRVPFEQEDVDCRRLGGVVVRCVWHSRCPASGLPQRPGASVSALGGYILCATRAARCLARWPRATVLHCLRIPSPSLICLSPREKTQTNAFLSLPALRLPRADVNRALIITSARLPLHIYIHNFASPSFFSAHIVHFTTAFLSAH